MPRIDRQTIEQLRELLSVYEQEIQESNYAPAWQRQIVYVSRQFVDWLVDEFDPGEYDGSRGRRRNR